MATGRKGTVDERKKGWTRKPETPKKRKKASVRPFLRSVHLREEYPILYSHKTQLNIKLSLLLYYITTCFGLNYRPSSGCI